MAQLRFRIHDPGAENKTRTVAAGTSGEKLGFSPLVLALTP